MNLEEIKELVQLVIDSGVAELEVTRGEDKVRIRRNTNVTTQEIIVPAQAASVVTAGAPASTETTPDGTVEDENQEYVKSPIVGTFYEAPAPDAPPFVSVGDKVTPGQVLCIIESMKLMNEIEAEISGTITATLVENGRPIEYGETLFAIRPE